MIVKFIGSDASTSVGVKVKRDDPTENPFGSVEMVARWEMYSLIDLKEMYSLKPAVGIDNERTGEIRIRKKRTKSREEAMEGLC